MRAFLPTTLILLATTPVDEQTTELFQTAWLGRLPDGEEPDAFQARLDQVMSVVSEDIAIWNHQRYLDPAGLAADEVRGFNAVRRWSSKFFPGEPAQEAASPK